MTDSEKRKEDHLALCATDRVAFRSKTTLLEQVELVHRALPELDLGGISLEAELGGRRLRAPFWIGAMTGGAGRAGRLNRDLAAIAQEMGIGMCLGSMRPMLDDPSRRADFEVRDAAPDVLLMANLGATEVARRGPGPPAEAARQLGADGICVHLNPLMELIQPGGDTDFRGATDAIASLVEEAPDLLIAVKETGCGLSWQDGEALARAGVRCVEVAGAGGTSWTGVETLRADGRDRRLGDDLWDWGIPTAVSTAWMVDRGLEVVASGGIGSGLDAARALALGARLAGAAAPVLRAFERGGADAARDFLVDLVEGLRYAMLACGAPDVGSLVSVPRVMGADLTRWIETGWHAR